MQNSRAYGALEGRLHRMQEVRGFRIPEVHSLQKRSRRMKLYATGWGRNMGSHVLMDFPLADTPAGDVFSSDGIVKTVPDGLSIQWGRFFVRLNGDYVFNVHLSKEDIARLFVQAFADTDLKTALDHIEKANGGCHRKM
jgi:hypothetical protein